MYEFVARLINVALPHVRDFHGVSRKAFDAQGNYNLGLREQTVFPEITFEDGSYIHTSLGTYFEGKGVKKQFVLRQGQKWNGGNNLDDYCH